MGSIRLNVSIDEEQKTFLDENPDLSASKILQQAIKALMNSYCKGDLECMIKLEKKKNTQMTGYVQQLMEWLKNKGYIEEWLKEKPKI